MTTELVPGTRPCATCGGDLIGLERAFGTCGHCGGRSLKPTETVASSRLTEVTPVCNAENDYEGETLWCALDLGHDGMHDDLNGARWSTPTREGWLS